MKLIKRLIERKKHKRDYNDMMEKITLWAKYKGFGIDIIDSSPIRIIHRIDV